MPHATGPTDAGHQRALTDRQAEVLRYLGRFFAQHQRFPTYREIASEVLGSPNPNAATAHLTALAAKGFITLDPRNVPLSICGLSSAIRPVVHEHVESLITGFATGTEARP